MNKTIVGIIVLCLCLCLVFAGCGATTVERKEQAEPPKSTSRFIIIEEVPAYWKVVVDKKTNVMYAVSCGPYNIGTFTLLVDADGKPLIYDEKREGA